MYKSVAERGLNVEFTQHNQKLPLTEWIALLTLCLAPLIAHIVAGAPQIVTLHNSKPKWHDTLALYSPISIIWRYYAIAERGFSTLNISSSELAAINAVYWTQSGWKCTESEIRQGQALCIRAPPPVWGRIVSSGGLKTLIVATQGVAAVGALVPGPLQQKGVSISLADIFMPVALLGIARLPAAYWLTDDYHILQLFEKGSGDNIDQQLLRTQTLVPLLQKQGHTLSGFTMTEDAELRMFPRYKMGIWMVIIRVVYVGFALLPLGLALFQGLVPAIQGATFSLTGFWLAMGYFLFAFMASCIYFPQYCQRRVQNICIPCANTTWYKSLTLVLTVVALSGILVAGLETTRTVWGTYSSYPFLFGPGMWQCAYSSPNGTRFDQCLTWGQNGVYDWDLRHC